jgi:hypothetical protein
VNFHPIRKNNQGRPQWFRAHATLTHALIDEMSKFSCSPSDPLIRPQTAVHGSSFSWRVFYSK